MNDRPGAYRAASFNTVLQFSHITWPIVSDQDTHGFLAQLVRPSGTTRTLFEELRRQQRDILASFPKGWNSQVQHIQAVEKIQAERALRDRLLQIAIGRSQNAHVNWH